MKKTIAVIFGGKSAEHDVSIITAHAPIINSLIATGQYDVIPIYISKDGSWYSEPGMNELSYFKNPKYEENLKKLPKLQIQFDDGLKLIWNNDKKITSYLAMTNKGMTRKVDIVFPAMHGTFGEDGSLTGLLRLADVPFVGCDLFASAASMDKVITKQILAAENVPVVPYVWFTKKDWAPTILSGSRPQASGMTKKEIMQKIKDLNWPVFVKPVHLGSSIAITKAKNEKELENAIEVALYYDDKVLVEESVENLIEVTLPIIGNEDPQLAGIERALNKTEFFDFNDKYLSGGKKQGGANSQYSEIPAKIDKKLSDEVQKYGKETYRILGCAGIARVDFLIDGKKKQVYVNEVNTLPGSLYEHNWRKMGMSNVDLITKLMNLAEERYEQQKKTTFTFKSEILKKVGGSKINS